MRTPSDSSSSQRLGTGQVESPVVKSTTSWPATWKPWARRSTTSSIPPYRCGGTGAHGGATSPMRIERLQQSGASASHPVVKRPPFVEPAVFFRRLLRTLFTERETQVTDRPASNSLGEREPRRTERWFGAKPSTALGAVADRGGIRHHDRVRGSGFRSGVSRGRRPVARYGKLIRPVPTGHAPRGIAGRRRRDG